MRRQRSLSGFFLDFLLLLSVSLAMTFGLFGRLGSGGMSIGIVAPFLAIGVGFIVSIRSTLGKRKLATHLKTVSLPYIALVAVPLAFAGGIALENGSVHLKATLIEFSECMLFWTIMELSALFAWENSRRVAGVLIFCSMALFVNLILWLSTGIEMRFEGFTTHKNVLGGISLFIGVTCLVQLLLNATRPRWSTVLCFITLTLSFAMAFASGSRTSLLCLVAAICLAAALKVLYVPRFVLWVVPIGTLLFVLLAPFAYLNLEELWFFDSLDQAVRSFSSNGIYSGRETKWGDVLSEASQRPIFGHGYQWKIFHPDKTLHAHNLYLGKMFQVGGFGLVSFFALNTMYIGQSLRSINPSIGCLYSIVLVHQCFEINYTMGGVPVGCSIAVLIGALIRIANQRSDLSDHLASRDHQVTDI